MDINTTPPILPIFFSVLLPLKNSHSLSCNYVPIVKTCGHVNLPRAKDGHEDVCLIKKNEVCDFFYNQSLEKLPKHFIHLRINCIQKNMFFSYSKGWWLPTNIWLSFFIGHTAFWPSCTLGRFPCPEVLIIETLIHDKLW